MAKIADPLDRAITTLKTAPPDPARPVLLAGPTASGKSALALHLAEAQGRVIVNADALQVYAMWRVLSARPDEADCARAPHLLYGHVGRNEDWSAGHWLRAVADVLKIHFNPVIVGGTGLYFRALTEGLVEIPPTSRDIRLQADAKLRQDGLDVLLAEIDPETRARIDCANPARVQRAWEVLQATGQGLASWQDQTPPPLLPHSATTAYVLRPEVDWLDARITRRFHEMMMQGALDEARAALPYWDPGAPWAKAIGAPELIAHLQGQMSWEEASAAATLATRQYAKRQRTWFRSRMKGWQDLFAPSA
ncbi:MAG: tRNA (adenosine(37)-N6)-dimethylallyltransferase MiaA [Natronohydrobacter sp.]|nr:tRNA (adenosine(37)-N6)-dimethylallyltransferase MiaA [Natronohydrobacter sp.]